MKRCVNTETQVMTKTSGLTALYKKHYPEPENTADSCDVCGKPETEAEGLTDYLCPVCYDWANPKEGSTLDTAEATTDMDATYSPEDNKLRLYPTHRLDSELYARVKAAGFRWAPKQKLFVAPGWTPGREDLLAELCGEVGDEDTSLADRAAERAERFEEYKEKRGSEAEIARGAVSQLADGIPLGQPILVGHHSEKRARKDAERIENGMRRAVKLWETRNYWESRAAGAISNARYKLLPKVRARRIKRLEAERRQRVRSYTPSKPDQTINQERRWCPVCLETYCRDPEHATARAEKVPHVWVGASVGGMWVAVERLAKIEESQRRWVAHLDHRIAYEKAMLGADGELSLLDKPKRPKLPPILNYREEFIRWPNRYGGEAQGGEQFELTKAQYKKIPSEYRGTRTIDGNHRVRVAVLLWVREALGLPREGHGHGCFPVFLTDSKTHRRPDAAPTPEPINAPPVPVAPRSTYVPREKTPFDDLKKQLQTGVKAVSAPQLFSTPAAVAKQMLELAGVASLDHRRILEPSAGTGALLTEVLRRTGLECGARVAAVEVNGQLCEGLARLKRIFLDSTDDNFRILNRDFLEVDPSELGAFDLIIMNPPFSKTQDIAHIQHARKFLRSGGTLVSVCANGPRQRKALEPSCDLWIDLPADSFKASGTSVNTALVVFEN